MTVLIWGLVTFVSVHGWTEKFFPSNRYGPVATNRRNVRDTFVTNMISEQQLGFFEVLEMEKSPSERRVVLLDYTSKESALIDFDDAWDLQKQILSNQIQRLSGTKSENGTRDTVLDESNSSFLSTVEYDGDHPIGQGDTIIMLQHHPVYTLGTGSDEKFVKESTNSMVPVIRMDRGGEVTYHGPGQITIYPVLDLRNYRQDIHWYMRALEEAILVAISRCGSPHQRLSAEREDGVTGVWIENHKVAAVGIKCRRWITQHGLAVNVEESSLSNFGGIVPCGLEGRKVGCLNQFLMAQGDDPITVGEFAVLMKEALEEVFEIELVDSPLL